MCLLIEILLLQVGGGFVAGATGKQGAGEHKRAKGRESHHHPRIKQSRAAIPAAFPTWADVANVKHTVAPTSGIGRSPVVSGCSTAGGRLLQSAKFDPL
ncbi:hypothetical protein JCM19368_33270 [Halomonas shantousis]